MKLIRQSIHFDKTLIDKDAKKVVKTLNKAGHEAYLVGGCIRDLLLGHKPKDFDIATNATPSQTNNWLMWADTRLAVSLNQQPGAKATYGTISGTQKRTKWLQCPVSA